MDIYNDFNDFKLKINYANLYMYNDYTNDFKTDFIN